MVLDSFRLDGRAALVTGATTGLGQAMAVALAQAGADIISLDRRPAAETQALIAAAGRRCAAVTCDLQECSVADLQATVGEAALAFGRLDVLVNNAGIILRAPALEVTEADWDAVLQINLKAAFFLAQAAARQMLRQGSGKIIQVASMLSFQGGIRVPAYAASKSGLAGLTRALANEWAPHNINVNAIAPGYMATNNTAALRADPDRSRAILERIPAGRWGLPADLAGAVVFLASSAADYVHGAVVPVDGGWLSR
jgi:2-deoxy-D-gluconate 3-dehydrogenase